MNYSELTAERPAQRPPGFNYKDAGYVYAITNNITGAQYVGGTVRNPKKRKSVHLHRLRTGTHHSHKLQASWNTFGEKEFTFKVLLVCPKKLTSYYEGLLLPSAEYNILMFGQNAAVVRWAGHTKSVKIPADMSAVRREVWKNPNSRANIIAGLKKANTRPEVRARRVLASKGRKHSNETKTIISKSKLKRVFCPELNVIFFSQLDAADYFGVCKSAVSNAMRGGKIARKYSVVRV